MSKTTKLILHDSLLQEVCISSVFDGSLTLSSLGLSVCLSQSQTPFCRAKESPLNLELAWNEQSVLCACVCLTQSESLLPSPLKPLACLHIPKQNRHTHIELFDISHTGINHRLEISFSVLILLLPVYMFLYMKRMTCVHILFHSTQVCR